MLINLSNHPSSNWSGDQLDAAKKYGEIVDMQFPNISPDASSDQIAVLVNEYFEKIQQMGSNLNVVIHLMGEMTFTFLLLKCLQNAGYKCIASTTQRIVEDIDANEKKVLFKFCQFREYKL